MGYDARFSNSTNVNSTFVFAFPDIFCTTMSAGPIVWGMCGFTCVFLGGPISVCLLWILIRRQCHGSTNDTYMLSLTTMDFFLNFLYLPNLLNYFIFKNLQILFYSLYFIWLNLIGRPLTMVFMCVDCYMAVVWPITYMRIKDKPYRLVIVVLVWACNLFFGVTTVQLDLSVEQAILTMYPLFLMTIAFCDVSILRTLRKPDPSGKTDVHPQKKRAQQIIINSLIMSLVSYLPTVVLTALSFVLPLGGQELNCKLKVPSYVGACLGSVLMPVLFWRSLRDNRN